MGARERKCSKGLELTNVNVVRNDGSGIRVHASHAIVSPYYFVPGECALSSVLSAQTDNYVSQASECAIELSPLASVSLSI